MFVVTVTFSTKSEDFDGFLRLLRANAETSLREEPGCLQFDVCLPENTQAEVFLYEVYNSRSDFEEHLKTTHFQSFDAEVQEMVTHKSVAVMTRL